MIYDLGRIECRICGRAIFFPLEENGMTNGERLIELTCSRGHTDSYWDVEKETLIPAADPVAEYARVAAI